MRDRTVPGLSLLSDCYQQYWYWHTVYISNMLDVFLTGRSTYEGKCPTFNDVTKGESRGRALLNGMIEVVESIHAV